MNIIISEELHNKLQKHIVSTIEFGSALKGEKRKDSDSDLLHIVESADWWTSSVVANQHLLQYKTENEDHIYCNAHTFVKSLLDGDTTIFVEMHKYGGLKNTCLEFLEKYDFTYYKTLRAYLGISRRDIKDVRSLWKNKDTLIRKINKKLKFAEQGIMFVMDYLEKNKDNINEYNEFISKFNDIYNIEDFKKGEKYVSVSVYSEFKEVDIITKRFNEWLDYIRNNLNKFIEAGYLKKTFEKEEFLILTHDLNENIKVKNTMNECENEVMTYFYNSYIGEV
jgi:hypothetical protein